MKQFSLLLPNTVPIIPGKYTLPSELHLLDDFYLSVSSTSFALLPFLGIFSVTGHMIPDAVFEALWGEEKKRDLIYFSVLVQKLPLREFKYMSSLRLQFGSKDFRLSFAYTGCFILALVLPTRPGVAGYLLNNYGPCMTYSVHKSALQELCLFYMQLFSDDSGSCYTQRPWHSLAIHRSTFFFFFFNVVWKKLFLGKQIISVPEAFALGVSKGKALKKCAKQQSKPPTVLKRRLNILKEMLGLFQFLQKHLLNPLPHFQALVLGTQHLDTLNENSTVSRTTLCEH